jgi:hypothetical protein
VSQIICVMKINKILALVNQFKKNLKMTSQNTKKRKNPKANSKSRNFLMLTNKEAKTEPSISSDGLDSARKFFFYHFIQSIASLFNNFLARTIPGNQHETCRSVKSRLSTRSKSTLILPTRTRIIPARYNFRIHFLFALQKCFRKRTRNSRSKRLSTKSCTTASHATSLAGKDTKKSKERTCLSKTNFIQPQHVARRRLAQELQRSS